MKSEPFIQVDEITRIITEICASRLDPNVSAIHFAELIHRLIEEARSQGYRTGVVTARERIEAPPGHIPPQPLSPDDELRRAARERRAQLEQVRIGESVPPRQFFDIDGRKKVPDEKRKEIRERYMRVCERNNGKAPRGFLTSVARELQVTPQTVYNILREN